MLKGRVKGSDIAVCSSKFACPLLAQSGHFSAEANVRKRTDFMRRAFAPAGLARAFIEMRLPALIASASSRYRAPASGAQPFPFAYDGVSLRARERDKERGKNEPPSPSSARPVQHPETAFRTQQDDGGLPYGHRWSFRLQAPERREGTLLLGRPLAAPCGPRLCVSTV